MKWSAKNLIEKETWTLLKLHLVVVLVVISTHFLFLPWSMGKWSNLTQTFHTGGDYWQSLFVGTHSVDVLGRLSPGIEKGNGPTPKNGRVKHWGDLKLCNLPADIWTNLGFVQGLSLDHLGKVWILVAPPGLTQHRVDFYRFLWCVCFSTKGILGLIS